MAIVYRVATQSSESPDKYAIRHAILWDKNGVVLTNKKASKSRKPYYRIDQNGERHSSLYISSSRLVKGFDQGHQSHHDVSESHQGHGILASKRHPVFPV